MISTPFSVATRRQQIETARQERLMMSTEKSKKAEETKKALLDSRINAMKTKREKRMDKFAENKKAIDHEKEEKLKAIVDHSVPVVTLPPGPTSAMTKAEARNAERRLKLAQMQLEYDKANEAKKAAEAIATTSKATGAKALKATKSAKNQAKKGVGKKQTQPKPVEVEQEPTDAQPAKNDVAALVMSPIAKLSGINGKINVTFTAGPGPSPFTTPKADVSVAVGNCTFICAPGPLSAPASGDGTFKMASAPPSTTPNKTHGRAPFACLTRHCWRAPCVFYNTRKRCCSCGDSVSSGHCQPAILPVFKVPVECHASHRWKRPDRLTPT